MAQNNSSASVAGPARPAGARLKKRALSPSSAIQLFLEQRRRGLRNSTSPETDSSSQSSPSPPSLASLPRKVKFSDVAQALILHRHLGKPLAPGKLAKLYSRHRNPERALKLFLLRRQLWRRSRRPTFNMDFIDHLRRIQADEVSSDEESGLILTSVTTPAPRRRQTPAPNHAALTAPNQPAEAQVTVAKRNLDPTAEPASADEANAETSRAAKKAKAATPSPAVDSKPATVTSGSESAAQSNGAKGSKKRAFDDQKTEGEGELPAAKKIKPENRNAVKSVTTKAESSKAAPAAPISQKPIGRMEYFEQRVYEMLTDPLDFDDFVYDSNKPIPRHVARSFAQCRRGQTQPPPPLVMSGAIGSASDAKSATTKPKGSGSLAKEAQKRAHQQKVKEQVQPQKGKAVEGRGFVGSKQPVMSKANVGKGKGKERAWLTNARQKPNVNLGGQRHQTGVKKYNKSIYSDVPTMSGAKVDNGSPSKSLKAQLHTTTNQTADVELPAIPQPIDHGAQIMSGAIAAEPTMSGAINTEVLATGGNAETPTMSGAISAAVPSKAADSAKVPTMDEAIANNKVATGGTALFNASTPSTSVVAINAYTALGSNKSQKKTKPHNHHPSDPDHKPGTA